MLKHYKTRNGTKRGQSKRAEKAFLRSPEGKAKGWTRQCSVKLKFPPPGKCRPDLFNKKLGIFVELKDIGERYTENQKRFRTELAKQKHRPHALKDFVTVSPETCA